MKIYIGTSGWQYYHWYGKFYPENLKAKDFLNFYAKHFKTVEVNTSFYHFTKESTFKNWLSQVPKNFLFSIKLHRLFTHFRRLKLKKEDKRILKETIDGYKVLGKNLGVILIQLPPGLKKDIKLLKNFLKILKDISSYKFAGKNAVRSSSRYFLRFAIEFRHKSWLDKEVYKILKENKIAFVISDSPKWLTDIVKTADFVYVRFHGKPKLFASKYSKEELKDYAEKIKKLKPKILFAYFNNDFEGYAVENALQLKRILTILN
ncbi:MAG: hypothetical protein KatS3mg097_614 [Candidatus Parcubacteria bacterium]|nr:MAG: hypothetical protein KatS3mg097_614 [Candidatus Parcubacteria bacterium]